MATQPNEIASTTANAQAVADPAPAGEAAELRPLHPNVLRVWQLSAGIGAAIFGIIAIGAAVGGAVGLERGAYIFSAVSGLIALIFVWSAAQYSGWRFDAWRYGVRQHDVVAQFGVLWRTRRCIPRLRIQHVDIASGPIDRMFGMANVSLFTAGNIAAVITIPGVTPEEAERLRTTLLNLETSDERAAAPPASGQHAD